MAPGNGNHPNDTGYRIVADTFFDQLAAGIIFGTVY